MKNILMRMVKDFNEYSELVALNFAQIKNGKCNDKILQWNRGHKACIEDYLRELADSLDVNLAWECKERDDDRKRTLTYTTVSVSYKE